MKIIILGAGAIGSLYGAKLSEINEVTLIARKEHARAINQEGLRITGIEKGTYRLKAKEKIYDIEENTLVLLATKVYDSKQAILDIKSLIRKDTIILCMQNGLYSEEIVKEIVGKKCKVLRAVTNFGAAFLEPGCIQYNSYSYTAIEKSPCSEEIAGIFTECGLNGYVAENIKEDMWKKLILNCVLNPITSILKIENRGIADGKLMTLKKLIVLECLEVARRDGVFLEGNFVKEIDDAIKNSSNISSMQQDLLKGKRTEIEYLNGAVAKLGKKYGIECNVNIALAMIIKEMEKFGYAD